MMKFINKSIRNKIIFWMLLSLIISSFTILTSTSQKIKEDHLALAKQQLQLFSNTIFNQLRMKMAEGNTQEMNLILERAKGFQNVYDVKIHKSEKLQVFTNSNEKLTTDKEIISVFALKSSLVEEKNIDGNDFVKLATPIIASNECLKCHTNQKDGDVVAVMEIVFSLDSFDQHSQDIVWNIVYSSFFFGFITIIVLLFIINRATEPIEGLKYGFQRLLDSDDGRSNVKLKIRTNDEIGDVALLFNQYIDKLTLEFKQNTEKFAQNIMDAQSDLIITYDENKKISNVNRAFLNYFSVSSLEEFIKIYGENIALYFVNNDSDKFIQETIDGIPWEQYIQEDKHTIHKVILKNHKNSEVFTVSTNSISFDKQLYTTSVFTNINEIEKIRKEVEKGHQQLKTLFNNANEGFLYFDRSMKIGTQYSTQAKEIFGCDLENRKITDMLFDDLEERNFIEDTLVSILDETASRQEVLISLLKHEFIINHKFIEVQYKVLGNSGFMLILEDVSENKILNEKIAQEQQIYKMAIAVIAYFDQFIVVKDDYREFVNTIEEYKKLEKLPDLRREIHTYKGLFAQLEMVHVVKKLHELETEIDNSIKFREISDDVYYLTSKILFSWLEHDVEIVNGILNQDILTKSHVYKIEKERIDEIYANIDNCEDIESLKHQVIQLTYRNIKETFYGYAQLVRTLSNRFDKPMHELIIESDDIYLSSRYQPFLNTLVHLFRNSLDHGIESVEEREIFQKDPKGTISCSIAMQNDQLIIVYKDDGKGIDLDRLKEKLVSKQVFSIQEVEQLTQDQLLQQIFADGFSTADIVSEISGRGVGLYSLKNEVEKLNGSVKIINYPHEGIAFIFKLTLF